MHVLPIRSYYYQQPLVILVVRWSDFFISWSGMIFIYLFSIKIQLNTKNDKT